MHLFITLPDANASLAAFRNNTTVLQRFKVFLSPMRSNANLLISFVMYDDGFHARL